MIEDGTSIAVVLCPMDKCANVDTLRSVADAGADGNGYFIWNENEKYNKAKTLL